MPNPCQKGDVSFKKVYSHTHRTKGNNSKLMKGRVIFLEQLEFMLISHFLCYVLDKNVGWKNGWTETITVSPATFR